jgi:hypothetical protein
MILESWFHRKAFLKSPKQGISPMEIEVGQNAAFCVLAGRTVVRRCGGVSLLKAVPSRVIRSGSNVGGE